MELCFYGEYPALKSSEKELYAILFKKIREAEADPTLVEKYLISHKESQLAHKTASLALEVYEGRKPFSELQDVLKEIDAPNPLVEEQKFVTSDLRELYDQHAAKPGLRWRLRSLNLSLGSLRKGDFGFLFARPETGKTTFLASEITHMATQLTGEDGPILWFNNEEQGTKVMRRIYCAALGITERELFADIEGNRQKYKELVKDKILLIDEASISKSFVEKIMEQYKPSLAIFDQGDKITGFDADREDLVHGKNYQWQRELAKTYCPIVGVCQADGTGEGVKWLTMKHVANAKTAKQAEADWILGIGRSNDEGMEYIRYLHASKNKLSGDLDSDPAMRHLRTEVVIKPDIARYMDVNYD